jgi:hypothetical protein
MVNLLRSQQLIELSTTTIDWGLDERTTLNGWLCFGCWRWFGDSQIDSISGECIRCTRVASDEGEESEDELEVMD